MKTDPPRTKFDQKKKKLPPAPTQLLFPLLHKRKICKRKSKSTAGRVSYRTLPAHDSITQPRSTIIPPIVVINENWVKANQLIKDNYIKYASIKSMPKGVTIFSSTLRLFNCETNGVSQSSLKIALTCQTQRKQIESTRSTRYTYRTTWRKNMCQLSKYNK